MSRTNKADTESSETLKDEVSVTTSEVTLEKGNDVVEDAEIINDPHTDIPKGSGDSGVLKGEQSTQTENDAAPEEVASIVTPPTAAPADDNGSSSGAGFFALFLGGVVAAGIGFGVAQYMGPLGGDDSERVNALQNQLQTQKGDIDALRSELAALSAIQSTASQDDIANLDAGLSSLSDRMAALETQIGGFDDRFTALEKRPISEGISNEAISAYEREVEALKAAVSAQRDEAASLQTNAQMTAQQALARAAMTRVFSALDSGASYRSALIDLTNATGVTAPQELADHADTGVPTLVALIDAFPDSARDALAAARVEEGEDGGITTFFKTHLGARSVTPQDGTDADAILSRAEDALRNGRVTDTLAELQSLPDVAQSELSDWIDMAVARRNAIAAADTLMHSLNSQ